MSVRGEFARTLTETVECLSESSGPDARRLALRLERTRRLAHDDLETAARVLLAEWEAEAPASLPPATAARLGETSERLLAIARIIIGR